MSIKITSENITTAYDISRDFRGWITVIATDTVSKIQKKEVYTHGYKYRILNDLLNSIEREALV